VAEPTRPPTPAPASAWARELARQIVPTILEVSGDGGTRHDVLTAVADQLDEALPHLGAKLLLVEQLADVYTRETDQIALIRLVTEARMVVSRG
jgi:hypothetical protein